MTTPAEFQIFRASLPPRDRATLDAFAQRIKLMLRSLAPGASLNGLLAGLRRALPLSLSDPEVKALLAYSLMAGSLDQALSTSIKQTQESQMSFNLQYLQLQSHIQSENRLYTAVSNIMKTKHETVKNSISNIR